MELRIGKTRLRAHPLMLLFPAAAAMLGAGEDAAALLLGLVAHEGGHLAAARWLRVGVSQLRLMPFGGAIALDNPYALEAGRLFAVAAAGPAGSLLALLTGAALAHWGVLPPLPALALMRANLLLLLVNLLPALPLDGGRMLYALLFPRIGRERAAAAGILLGRIAAAGLLALAAAVAVVHGRLNLSPLFCAVFMLAAAPDERQALSGIRARALLNAMTPPGKPVAARVCVVNGQCPVRTALRAADPGAPTLFAVYSGDRLSGFTDDRGLLRAALVDSGASVSSAFARAVSLPARASNVRSMPSGHSSPLQKGAI